MSLNNQLTFLRTRQVIHPVFALLGAEEDDEPCRDGPAPGDEIPSNESFLIDMLGVSTV
jgi:hypothetical protein